MPSITLSFEAVAIILSLNSPDHDQDEPVWMLCSNKVNVTRVRIWHRVRCYSQMSLRESSPPRTMFRVHYSSLDSLACRPAAPMQPFCRGGHDTEPCSKPKMKIQRHVVATEHLQSLHFSERIHLTLEQDGSVWLGRKWKLLQSTIDA